MTLVYLLTGISPLDRPRENSRGRCRERVSLPETLLDRLETLTEPAAGKRSPTARVALSVPRGERWEFFPTRPGPEKPSRPARTSIRPDRRGRRMELFFPPRTALVCRVPYLVPLATIGIFGFSLSPIVRAIAPFTVLLLLGDTEVQFHLDRVSIRYEMFRIIYRDLAFDPREIKGVFLHGTADGHIDRIRSRTERDRYFLGHNLTEDECLTGGQAG